MLYSVVINLKTYSEMKRILLIVFAIIGTTALQHCKKKSSNPETFNEYFVISNLGSNSLSIVDASSKSVISTVSIPNSLPYYSVYLPGNDKIYVTDAGNSAVQIINGSSFANEGRITVAAGTIMHIAADKTNNKLWVVNNTAKTITEINANSGTAAYTFQLTDTPHDIAVNADGSKIFVSVNKGGTWFVDSYSTNRSSGNYTLVESKSFGNNWLHFAFSTVNNRLYAADQGNGVLWALNPNNLSAPAPSIPIPGAHGITLSTDEKWTYVASITENKIYLFNNSNNSIASQITSSITPNVHNLAVTRNNDWLMDTHSGASSNVAITYSIANASLSQGSNITTGTNPQGITYFARKK